MYQSGLYTSASVAQFQSAQTWLGKSLDFISWSTGKANWSDYTSSVAYSLKQLQGNTAAVHWTIPLFANGGTLSAAASHSYDSYYTQVAKQLAASVPAGQKIVIRVGEEFNGNWMGWSAAGKEADFAQAYRNFVNAFRAVDASKFQFEFNVAIGNGGTDIAKAYPGDSYVDYIGGDLYWNSQKSWSISDPAQAFNYYKTTNYGLDWLSNFAASHGKQIAFSEWGVNSNNASAFVTAFQSWMASHNVAYQSYWDSNGGGFAGQLDTGAYPATAATFKALFGAIVNRADAALAVIEGDDSNNTLIGTDVGEIIRGHGGHDILMGGGGADSIIAGDGNNHVYGNALGGVAGAADGADTITVGTGINYVNGNAGDDVITAGADGSTGSNRLYGGQGDDTITIYGAGSNTVNGNLGNDIIHADTATGNNMLRGGQGDDLIYAGQGHDTLSGDLGNDTLVAGGAAGHLTVMTGGSGADLFVFSTTGSGATVSIGGATSYQEITDFTPGTDHIGFAFAVGASDVLAGSADSVAAAQAWAQSALAGHAGTTDVAAVQVGADTFLFYNDTGSSDAITGTIKLDHVTATSLSSGDFATA